MLDAHLRGEATSKGKRPRGEDRGDAGMISCVIRQIWKKSGAESGELIEERKVVIFTFSSH